MKYTTLEIPHEQKVRIDRLIKILNQTGAQTTPMQFVTFALAKVVNEMYEELEKNEQDNHVYAEVQTACSGETLPPEP